MIPDFSEENLRMLFEAIQMRASSFDDHLNNKALANDNPIYLRFDIDDNLRKAFEISCICNQYGIKATFFILNTAKYWNDQDLFIWLKQIHDKGHEIAWHNNVLTEWQSWKNRSEHIIQNESMITSAIRSALDRFRFNGIIIKGSASHGDPLCRKLNYLNYDVFTECERGPEAHAFPKCALQIPKVSMHDFGLEYEAYHVPYDLYLSESGGKGWSGRCNGIGRPDLKGEWTDDNLDLSILSFYEKVQILIHPQHWKI